MKNNLKKWIALFLSVAMIAVSGITTNTSFLAAGDTEVQETADGESPSANGITTTDAAAETPTETPTQESTRTPADTQTQESTDTADNDTEKKSTEKTEEVDLSGTTKTPTPTTTPTPTEKDEENQQGPDEDKQVLNESTKTEYTCNTGDITVTATLSDPNAVPDSAEFVVTPVQVSTPGYEYDAYLKALNSKAGADTNKPVYTNENTLFYDLAFYCDEQQDDGTKRVEYEPRSGSVRIDMPFDSQLKALVKKTTDAELKVAHLKNTGYGINTSVDIEDIDSTVSNQTVSFTQNSFSVVAITVQEPDPYITGEPDTSTNYSTILGKAVDFGIVTGDFWLTRGDAESNLAAKKAICTTQMGNDLTNPAEQTFILAKINQEFKIKGTGNNGHGSNDVYVKTTKDDKNKLTALGSVRLYVDDSETGEQLQQEVQDMLDYGSNQSLSLAGKKPTAKIVRSSSTNYILDIKNGKDGTYYVNVDDDILKGIQQDDKGIQQDDNLKIYKNDNQTVVFNVNTPAEAVSLYKFKVNDQSATKFINDTNDNAVTKNIIWNFPNATQLNINGSVVGVFLAPKAEVTVNSTSAGWIVSTGVKIESGEWHNVYQHVKKLRKDAEAVLSAKKNIDGKAAKKAGFIFTLSEKTADDKWDKLQEYKTSADNSSVINFDPISYTGIEFEPEETSRDFIYKISEIQGEKDSDGNEYTADSSVYYAKVTVSKTVTKANNTETTMYTATSPEYYNKYDDGKLSDRIDGVPVFNNQSKGDKTQVSVSKKWDPEAPNEAKVEFTLYQNDATTNKVITLDGIPDNQGETEPWKATFLNLPKTDENGQEYVYTVRETSVNNADGFICSEETAKNGDVITNKKQSASSIDIGGTKTLKNRELKDKQFTFILENGDRKQLQSTENDEKGNFQFQPINYTESDLSKSPFTYYVVEKNDNKSYITYDSRVYQVKVTLSEDEDGQLTAAKEISVLDADGSSQTEKAIQFENSYNYQSEGSAQIRAEKSMIGRELKENEFSFDLTDEKGTTYTAKNDAKGNIIFDAFHYTQRDIQNWNDDGTGTGTKTYTLKEVSGNDSHITYDPTVYTVTVNLTDDGKGKIETAVTYAKENSESSVERVVFNNIYTAEGSVVISGTKTLEGKKLEGGQFKFVLEDSKGNVLQTVQNDASGNFSFQPITYTDVKNSKFVYYVVEWNDGKEGYIYDSTIYRVTVTLTEESGKIIATPSYEKADGAQKSAGETVTGSSSADANFTSCNGISFLNTWTDNSTAAIISGTKTLTNGTMTAGQFRFDLYENSKKIDTAANDADGKFTFAKIIYNPDDVPVGRTVTHTYTIKEENGGRTINGIRYSSEEKQVTVNVSKDNDGRMTVTSSGGTGSDSSFVNEKLRNLTVHKRWNDNNDEAGVRPSSITVDLQQGNTVIARAVLSESNGWSYTFTDLPYETYTVVEEEIGVDGYQAENGGIVVADTETDAVTLVNDYNHPSVDIIANKVLTGATLTNGEFMFQLHRNSDPAGVITATAVNNAAGEIIFSNISYDPNGYTVTEVAGDDVSITYDTEPVIFSAEGAVTSSAHPEFRNTYRPILLRVQKRSKEAPYDPLVGATYGLYQVVEGGNDILVESEISDENGYMYYGRIQPGVIYYFKEIAAPEGHEVDPYPGQKFQVKYTGNGQIALYDENGNPTTVGDITGQDNKNLLVQYTAEKTAVDTSSSLSYSDDSIVAVAKADNSKAFAAGTKLKVTQLSGSEAKTAAAAVEAACGKIDSNIAYYDIQFIDASGNEVEPAGGDVTVTIQYKGSLDLPEGTDRTALKLVHLTKEANGETTVEAVPGTVAADQDGLLQTSFTSDSFSTFGVVEPGSDNTLGQNYLVTAAGVADQVSELKVAKLDTAGKYIKGAKLQIIEKATGNVVAEWNTSDGPQSFARWFDDAKTVPMNVDTYYILHEVSAPDGYQLADDILFMINKYDSSITVYKYDENGKLVIDQEAIDKWVSDTTLQMIDVPVKHETVTLVKQKLVPNEKTIQGEDKIVQVTSVKAVKTGDTSPIAFFTILLAAAAAVLLILLYRGRKKKDS